MNLSWTETWSIGVCLYGVYLLVKKPEIGVGVEGVRPFFYLGGKGRTLLAMCCILGGGALLFLAWNGFQPFD